MPVMQLPSTYVTPVVYPRRLRVFRRRVAAGGEGAPGWGPSVRCEAIEPLRLRWGANGALTTLSLSCQLGRGPGGAGLKRIENPGPWPAAGDEIILVDDADGPWFVGHVGQESILIQSNPDAESRSIVAYGPEIRLRAKAVHGCWCKKPAADDKELAGTLTAEAAIREAVFVADLPTVFNADGRPNASQSPDAGGVDWSLSGTDAVDGECRVFEPAGRLVASSGGGAPVIEAEHWTAYTALRSLIEYVDGYGVISPTTDWEAIKGLLAGVVLPQVVLEGASLLTAIGRILSPVGFGFRLEPWPDGQSYDDGCSRHLLGVFERRPTQPRGQAPVLADTAGGRESIATAAGRIAQVQRLEFLRDCHNVSNDVTVVGDVRRVQVCLGFDANAQTRDLHPAWNTADHDLDDWAVDDVVPEMDAIDEGVANPPDNEEFLQRYCRGGDENLTYFDVFRTFVWNEDGAYLPDVTRLPDLTEMLGSADFMRRPRPVGPTLLRATEASGSGRLPAYVEIGVDGDDNSWILLPHATVLADRAGFTIHIPRPDTFYPYANAPTALREKYCLGRGKFSLATLLHNALRSNAGATDYAARFRLVGSIAADAAVTGRAPYRLDSSWPFASSRVEYRPDRFRLASVAPGGNPGDRAAVTADDSLDAAAYAEAVRDAGEDAMGHGSVVLRSLVRNICPGMAWSHTGGRQVSLTVGGGAPRPAGVIGVSWIFAEGANKTEVILDSPLLQVNP